MECADMLDVVHVFFEESFSHATDEHAQRISATREAMYQSLYGRDYPYAYGRDRETKEFDPESMETIDDWGLAEPEEIKVFNPKTKNYVPPTKVDADSSKPFGSILDAPLG
ncbi:MAG: hypothetical protein ACRC5T_03710 [Cetobacterium sp.]